MEPPPNGNAGVGAKRQQLAAPQGSNSNNGQHLDPIPAHLEHLHAAQVLASFNQYPIRQAKNGAGYPLSHRQASAISGQSSQRPLVNDPLLQDMQSHSRDLAPTLLPILHTPEGAPGTDYDLNNCRGVAGIGGSMLPVNALQTQNLQYVTPATSSPSQGSPTGLFKHDPQTFANTSPTQPQPKPVIKPEKEEFKTTFQFVVNEDAKEARNTVRKHVMREYRRRERWEQGQKGQPSDKKLPNTAKKRRRKQAQSPTEAEQVSQHSSSDRHSPLGSANDQRIEHEQKHDSPRSDGTSSSSNGSSTSAPTKKKAKMIPPVFPESRQHQLWGAVSTDYDEAIHELEGNTVTRYRADPWAAVGTSDVDPFTKFELGPATQSLLHHFAWVMPSLMDEIVTGKVFNRIGWLYSSVAVHDPTPVHVILGYTLGHIASLRGMEEPPLAIEHKQKAIKLLHARMVDPETCYSDGLIGAILNFAGWELICANPKAYAMHMSGLSRIITARGGMSAFQNKAELETVLVRLDVIRAYATISAPRYPAFAPVRTLEPLAINVPQKAGRSLWYSSPGSRESGFTPFEYRYCEDALVLINKLEDVLLLARSAATDLSGPVGEPFRKLLNTSLDQMLEKPSHLIFSPGATSPTDLYTTDIYAVYDAPSTTSHNLSDAEKHRLMLAGTALRLAALTYLDAAVREFFDAPPYAGYYTTQLKSRFLGSKALANDSPWGRSLEMVIAVLLQADRMALERPWRAWYVADALTQTMRVGEWTWEEVVRGLKTWVEAGGLATYETNIHNSDASVRSGGSRNDVFGSRSSGAGSVREESEPRSKGVWDLKRAAAKFLREWGELPRLTSSSAENSGTWS